MSTQQQFPQIPRWLIWLVVPVLVLWAIFMFAPAAPGGPTATVPYSTFLAQVRAGNVASVHVAGEQITGRFIQAVPADLLTPLPASAPSFLQATPVEPTSYERFSTTFPQAIGDPALVSLLESQGVVIDVSPPSNPLLSILLSTALPVLLLVGVMVWMSRRSAQDQRGAFDFGRSRARQYVGSMTQITFDDVAGVEEAKMDLQEVVDFLRNPQKYHDIGAHIPRGVLLVGPPGTGKTLLGRAVAGEANVPFFNLSASEFVEMFVGVGASRVRDLFDKAKASAPSIVFIDELDAVGRRRGAGMGTVNDEREQTLNQLLVEMDGFDEHHEVIVLAATNRPDVLDPALQRPGRFDRQVTVPLPDRNGREAILRIHTRRLPLAAEVDLTMLAGTTTGFSGADLANLANEAALIAAREDASLVAMAHFEEALDKVMLGGVRALTLDCEERRVVSYHEAGHSLVAWHTLSADPVHKVTIIPRGRALGVTQQMPEEEHYNYSREYLAARLSVMLGGRTAEEVAIGDITTGAENDLVEATRLARRMVTRWSMGTLGTVAFQSDPENPFLGYELSQGREYSEATAMRIDEDVQRLLEERHEAARRILIEHRDQLDRLAEALLTEETVEREKLGEILGPRPRSEGPQTGEEGRDPTKIAANGGGLATSTC